MRGKGALYAHLTVDMERLLLVHPVGAKLNFEVRADARVLGWCQRRPSPAVHVHLVLESETQVSALSVELHSLLCREQLHHHRTVVRNRLAEITAHQQIKRVYGGVRTGVERRKRYPEHRG